MSAILALWLPILVSAVAVFVVSSIIHMVLPYHKSDHQQLPEEAKILEEMRKHHVQPGTYMFPHCHDMKDLGSPAMMEKFQNGPVGHMTIMPSGTPTIGKSLVLWFLYSVSVGVFCAYATTFALIPEADYMATFRLVGTVAFLGYGWGVITDTIWKSQAWSTTFKFLFDGLLYALVTAGVFGWLAA